MSMMWRTTATPRSPGGGRRRATTAEAAAVEPSHIDPELVEPAEPDTAADTPGRYRPDRRRRRTEPLSDDDILAELEEELRRESEQDIDDEDDGPGSRPG